MNSVEGALSLRSVGSSQSKNFLSHCAKHSHWFELFAAGCLCRMGQEVRQDHAISLPVLHALLSAFEEKWNLHTDPISRFGTTSLGAFSAICFCGSFRGLEVFLTDLFGLCKYLDSPRRQGELDFVIIPLLGKLKNKTGDKYHLSPLCSTTSSGIPVERWVHRLVDCHVTLGRHRDPAFTSYTGEANVQQTIEMGILDQLHAIQSSRPDLIPSDINVHKEYGISKSFRRGSTSKARAQKEDDRDVDLINRWRTFDQARGRRPRLTMHDHCYDIRLLIPALLHYSQALALHSPLPYHILHPIMLLPLPHLGFLHPIMLLPLPHLGFQIMTLALPHSTPHNVIAKGTAQFMTLAEVTRHWELRGGVRNTHHLGNFGRQCHSLYSMVDSNIGKSFFREARLTPHVL